MKVQKLGNYIFVIYALYQYLETTHEQFTANTLIPRFLEHNGMMSNTSNSDSTTWKKQPRQLAIASWEDAFKAMMKSAGCIASPNLFKII